MSPVNTGYLPATSPITPPIPDCHSPIRITDHICRKCLVWPRFTGPPNTRVCMTLPNPASINNVPHRSFRWYTVQMSTQLTTIMSCNKSIPNDPKSCCLSHVTKSLNCQCLQFCSKNGRLCGPLKLTPIISQPPGQSIMPSSHRGPAADVLSCRSKQPQETKSDSVRHGQPETGPVDSDQHVSSERPHKGLNQFVPRLRAAVHLSPENPGALLSLPAWVTRSRHSVSAV